MHMRGYLSPSSSGSFDIDVGPGTQTAIAIDGRLSALPVQLAPGVHHVAIDGTLTGTRWRLVPRWNGAELWSNVSATVQRPSIASLRVRSWARWIPLGVTALLLSAWIGALVNTSALDDKTWFVILLVLGVLSFGFIPMLVYVLAGPDGTVPPKESSGRPAAGQLTAQ